MVELAFAPGRESLDQQIWHQIEIDVPRTRPGVRLWMHAATQRVSVMCLICKISLLTRTLELREGSVCVGHPPSCQWIRAGNQ